VILELIDEAVESGARRKAACEILGLDPTTVQRWRKRGAAGDRRAGPLTKPKSALSPVEVAKILEIANSSEYRDKSPKQIVPLLADQGIFIASERSFYRVLEEAGQLEHREPSKPPTRRHRPSELVADGPGQVWSWDITYLHSEVKGAFYYLYMVLDVWSRKIVGFEVHAEESAEHAAGLIDGTCAAEAISRGELSLHSDNGSPMKGATMLAKLQDLGVAASFSRPSVSNDNPYSEAAFRTVKYRPNYPKKPFASIEEARAWVQNFVDWYNDEHLHSSIRFVTPSSRHNGDDVEILKQRHHVYLAAQARHPERWSQKTRDWSRVDEVILNPAPTQEEVKACA
jgi:transposase InsO family protein